MTDSDSIAFAQTLINAGIPVVVVGPGDKPRQARWQTMTAADSDLGRFHPGDALAMVTGHGLDVVDVDPKNGGTLDTLGAVFTEYGQTNTPSGGFHLIVASTGVGTMRVPGLGDYCGGHADGTSRGLAFLPGSKRTKYPDGGYTFDGRGPWRIDDALMIGPDPALRDRLLELGGTLERPTRAVVALPDDVLRDPALGVHPLAQERIDAELGRLKECQDQGWNGPPWDATTYAVACNLIELANTPWTGYALEQAEADLLKYAPTDDSFGEYRHQQKWDSALGKVGGGRLERLVPADLEFIVEEDAGRRPLPATSLEDDALAERIAPGVGDRLLAWGKKGWALWDGRRWDTTVPPDPVLRIVADALEDVMWAETDQAMDDRRKSMAQGGDGKAELKRITALAKLMTMQKIQAVTAALRTRLTRSLEDFDGPETAWLLNCSNGVVDLRTGELRPHDRALLFTLVTPVAYRPGAKSSDWVKALRALPPDVAEWMRLRFGQAATGEPPEDAVVPFLKGGGSNGKTTVLAGVTAALGEFARMASEKVLLSKNGDGSVEVFDLKGRRLVYLEELPDGNYVNTTRIKKLAGTEQVSARTHYENQVNWKPTHTLMVTTNFDTQISDTDKGTWRRLARVEFPYTFEGDDVDLTLRSRVQRGEAVEAVLAWVVSGAMEVYRLGGVMPKPAVVEADTEAWRIGSNHPATFIGEVFALKEDAAIPSSLVLRLYRQWARDNGHSDGLSAKMFWSRALQHRWFHDGRVQGSRPVNPGAYDWPGFKVEGESKIRALVGVELTPEGMELMLRVR